MMPKWLPDVVIHDLKFHTVWVLTPFPFWTGSGVPCLFVFICLFVVVEGWTQSLMHTVHVLNKQSCFQPQQNFVMSTSLNLNSKNGYISYSSHSCDKLANKRKGKKEDLFVWVVCTVQGSRSVGGQKVRRRKCLGFSFSFSYSTWDRSSWDGGTHSQDGSSVI